jgi:hypothetical protein
VACEKYLTILAVGATAVRSIAAVTAVALNLGASRVVHMDMTRVAEVHAEHERRGDAAAGRNRIASIDLRLKQ